uniref:Chromosome 18 open reading frame 54 n=1 Tax=Varanus komodoensis TaxID=61221 RepID=A0A8D2L478_VARKO
MSCLIKNSNVYSPESTVSSLLASCSLNSSSDSNSFQYKDKLYRSASQALEAYIEDFDLSLASSNLRPGKISITQSTPKDFSSSKDSFIGPHLRRKIAYEPDKLSLTTDDLLAFPPDGSVSFTRTAALRPAARSNNTTRKSLTASYVPRWTSSFDDDKVLLPKVRKALDSSVEELTSVLKNDSSPCTVDVLEAERSWDNVPVGLKSPVPVRSHICWHSFASRTFSAVTLRPVSFDCDVFLWFQESTFSGGNHHGPVEALKLMLFNLQAVQHSFNQNKTTGQKEEFKKVTVSCLPTSLLTCICITAALHLHYFSYLCNTSLYGSVVLSS